MKKTINMLTKIIVLSLLLIVSCQNKKIDTVTIQNKTSLIPNQKTKTILDSSLLHSFFKGHPEFQKYKDEVVVLYQKQQFHYIWFDQKGIKEVGYLLYNKATTLSTEGIVSKIPYQNELDAVFLDENGNEKPEVTVELLISCMYFYYVNKVYKGLAIDKSNELGWYLPRKKRSFVSYLDSILEKPSLINKDEKEISGQYYRLREFLKKYRLLAKNPWKSIEIGSGTTAIKIGDSAQSIAQIRNRLFLLGDISSDSNSAVYDPFLSEGIVRYKMRNGLGATTTITKQLVLHLNVPIAQRIKTIIVNMERCRWFSKPITSDKRFIFINIPAYQLRFFENEKIVLESKVVVGKSAHKTVVFSAKMKYIVFSPYWNIPKNIMNKEILPAIDKNPNYLSQHDMEWHNGLIRQKPGPKNALGKVKFIFPNSNAIYLHDTPSKGLFVQEKRAFSHGCIRLEKPAALAQLILKNDPKWSTEKIGKAMSAGVEKWYALPQPIPVYIGYFTAWVTQDGRIHFYDDIYHRDEQLSNMLLED